MNFGERRTLIESLSNDCRFDGRDKKTFREVTVETDVSVTAEGSAIVSIGDTKVIAGVKFEMGTPYADTPDEGSLMVGVELSCMASDNFETGPPSFDAIELARVTDRGIRESKCFDTKTLCIKKGEKSWTVAVDISIINYDGNLFDACSLAAMAAIKSARFPKIDKNGNADYHNLTKNGLKFTKIPIGVTVIKIGNQIFVDPTEKEMEGLDARLTVTSVEDDTICALQKGGIAPLSIEDVSNMTEIAIEKAKELRKLL